MRNRKFSATLLLQILIAFALAINIVIALSTNKVTLLSYICCCLIGILQAVIIIKGEWSK